MITLETEVPLREAKTVIEEAERTILSERDSLFVLSLLESPPEPNAKLRAVIAALAQGGAALSGAG